MKDTYSLYEAKARLSALVRQVREGRRVVITVHGKPAAELRPVEPEPEDVQARIRSLVERGEIVPADPRAAPFRTVARRPGGLKRFLADRD